MKIKRVISFSQLIINGYRQSAKRTIRVLVVIEDRVSRWVRKKRPAVGQTSYAWVVDYCMAIIKMKPVVKMVRIS